MKRYTDYIAEKFQITKDSKIFYSCCPKTVKELRNILEERLAENKDAYLNDIDVSAITDMAGMFYRLDPHNIHIEHWDVSNVENMRSMFLQCEHFNCDLSNWDVSKLRILEWTFRNCRKFTGEGLENWKPEKCINMECTFDCCYAMKKKPSWYK